ncbi:DNA adenine methylase [Pseudomonas mosselii]|uniref:DNA adenine methylase n=1 Tax=Pseudomonas mosselii TaxID=78327 RepID=UPI001F2F5C67|nr:DNA adenine methylase [Pseudomonas mosselii]
MGHKGKLLSFLGDILQEESRQSSSIADPFCGSGAVSWYLAQKTDKRVFSGDLQKFAVCRAAAVVERAYPFIAESIFESWFGRAERLIESIVGMFPNAEMSIEPNPRDTSDIIAVVYRSRVFCETVLPGILTGFKCSFPITKAYGGHYFSPLQALTFDALRATLPRSRQVRAAALAALIETASRCAASPGHTAQPFQPTVTSAVHILEAWQRPVKKLLLDALTSISQQFANAIGGAKVMDYKSTIRKLSEGDLVFADPPYSDVHYSRFYHVLETLAIGKEVVVTGRGRYPDISLRPSSAFSLRTKSLAAAKGLIDECYKRRLGLVLTFPTAEASNGLSSDVFMELAKGRYSRIAHHRVDSDFSTLGGNSKGRSARLKCQESIICFRL